MLKPQEIAQESPLTDNHQVHCELEVKRKERLATLKAFAKMIGVDVACSRNVKDISPEQAEQAEQILQLICKPWKSLN